MPTAPVSVRMDTGVKARLEEQAALEDRSSSYVIQKAVEDYLDAKAYKRECLKAAVEEADKGVFISEEAMDAWVESWDTDNELPPPKPDVFPDSQTR